MCFVALSSASMCLRVFSSPSRCFSVIPFLGLLPSVSYYFQISWSAFKWFLVLPFLRVPYKWFLVLLNTAKCFLVLRNSFKYNLVVYFLVLENDSKWFPVLLILRVPSKSLKNNPNDTNVLLIWWTSLKQIFNTSSIFWILITIKCLFF